MVYRIAHPHIIGVFEDVPSFDTAQTETNYNRLKARWATLLVQRVFLKRQLKFARRGRLTLSEMEDEIIDKALKEMDTWSFRCAFLNIPSSTVDKHVQALSNQLQILEDQMQALRQSLSDIDQQGGGPSHENLL